jgi:signal transduction histidine kinase
MPAAPALLVADGDPRAGGTQRLSAADVAGDALRRRLEACFAEARRLRGGAEPCPLSLRYRDFLGHELRSPLTALRTALEEIAASPGDPGPLPQIALRNVERLQQVLEWSQGLLALADLPDPEAREALAALADGSPWSADDADAAAAAAGCLPVA